MPTEPERSGIATTDDTELDKLLKWLRDTENSTAETYSREIGIEDYKFYAGDQDTQVVKTALESLKRPVDVFNEIKPKIDMLTGLAAQTKHEPTLHPVGIEDEPLAELMQGVLKFYHKQLKVSDKEVDCFGHTVQTGRSLLHFYIDTSNPFEPEIKCKRFPSVNFWLDPDGVELDLSDHRFIFLEKHLTAEEIKVFWPDVDLKEVEEYGKRAGVDLTFFNEAKDKYRIIECWYKKYVEVRWFINPLTNQPEYLIPKDFNKFVLTIQKGITDPKTEEVIFQDESGVEGIKSFMEEIHYMIFTANKKLEGGKSQYKWKGFPCILFGAYKDTDNNNWFGAVTMMKDPQRAMNTMLRQLIHLLQTLPKGMLAHEAGAILNIEEWEQKSSDPSFHLELAKGAMDKFRFESQPGISPIYQAMITVLSQIMKNAAGIQDPMMGISEGTREAGVTRRMKQETGIAVLFKLYDNFRNSRLTVSRLLLSLLQQYVTTERVIRIEGEKGASLVQINTQTNRQNKGFNDVSAGEFDVVVDEAVENATLRLSIAQILTEFSHNNPNSIPPDIILDYSDVPYTAKMRVKQFYEMQQKQAQANIDRDYALRLLEIEAKTQKPETKEKKE